jgi:hypothetical protein
MARQADLLVLLPNLIPHLVLKHSEAEVLLEAVTYCSERGGRGTRSTPEHAARMATYAELMLAARAARK